MGELRDEIAGIVERELIRQINRIPAMPDKRFDPKAFADRILALPQIAEALILLHQRRGDMAMVKIDENLRAAVAEDAATGIDTGPGSGNTPEDQRRDVL